MDRFIDVGADEMWTEYLEEINKLFHEEKKARHENDAVKLSEICRRIVSQNASKLDLGSTLFRRKGVQILKGVPYCCYKEKRTS